MHRMISTVFKILILSMLFMFLLDTSLLMVEIVTIHSKLSNVAGIMQTEVSRNNCMPNAMANTFERILDEIENNSTIMDTTKSSSLKKIRTNMSHDLTVGSGGSSVVYTSLNPNSPRTVGDYGDFVTLAIEATLNPAFVYYNPERTESNQSWLMRSGALDYKLYYIYTVPCLRYLK